MKKLKDILAENMHRFGTKNLNEDGDQNNNGYPDKSENARGHRKTAVEWLVEKLELDMYQDLDDNTIKIIDQAKAMEEQIIINSFDAGWKRANNTKDRAYATAEDHGEYYYKKLFK
jgi:hypothetical protein